MDKVGLTGGIGSGKSLVAKIFTHLGIPVFNADAEAGKILDEDLEVRAHLMEWIGPDAYVDGKPNRQKLAGIIFTNQEMLSGMNALIHPRVLNRFIDWCSENQGYPYLVHEAAILFESGFYKRMDATILVTAPEKVRLERIRQRDKVTEESIRQRMQNQWTDEQKIPLAGYIVRNDGENPLIPRILEIHNILIG